MDDDKRRTYAGSLSLLSPLVLLVLLVLIVSDSPLAWLVMFTATFFTMVAAVYGYLVLVVECLRHLEVHCVRLC